MYLHIQFELSLYLQLQTKKCNYLSGVVISNLIGLKFCTRKSYPEDP